MPNCYHCNEKLRQNYKQIITSDGVQHDIHQKCIIKCIKQSFVEIVTPKLTQESLNNYRNMELENVIPHILSYITNLVINHKFTDPQFDHIIPGNTGTAILFLGSYEIIKAFLFETKICYHSFDKDYYAVIKNPTIERKEMLKGLVKDLRNIISDKYPLMFGNK